MSVVRNTLLLTGDDGYQISRSVRLRSSASAYFNRTPAGAGSLTTWTWSGWIKRGNLGADQTLFAMSTGSSTTYTQIAWVGSTDALLFFDYQGGVVKGQKTTSSIYRDPSAWYHVVCVWDTTNATSADRMRLYVNGVRLTTFSASTDPSSSQSGNINTAAAHQIGAINAPSLSNYVDGYLTEVNFIDGQALTPSSFGETDVLTGVWKPKKYAGTYGTNGFYLNFSDPSAATAAAIGKDSSGNGNNWTPNNISVTSGITYDSMTDVPTLTSATAANYAVLNLLAPSSYVTISAGNLTATGNTATNSGMAVASFGVSSGKYVWEETITTVSGNFPGVGATTVILQDGNGQNPAASNTQGVYYRANGTVYKNSASLVGTYATFSNGDVVRFELDADALTCAIYKNNTLIVTVTGLTAGTFFPSNVNYNSSVTNSNFGQRPFANTPPTGFKALNTQNLPDATIKKGNAYFDATLWTGNGTSQSIVNSGAMQPDLVWTKGRSGASNHSLVDSVRGITLQLSSNLTAADVTDATEITALTSTGFSVGNSSGAGYSTNANGTTYVGWQWKESASAGFDIVTYTGTGADRTVSHSLGVAPKMVIVKLRSGAGENWNVWHTSLGGNSYRILLNTTGAVDTGSPTVWGSGGINPTSTTFQVGSASAANGNTATYVAYVFAEVAGFSKFGSYTGNGSTDGPFVYCGFRPRFVMIKNASDGTATWIMWDSARDTYNVVRNQLYPNQSAAEVVDATNNTLDFLSNGFKFRGASTVGNGNGNTIIYAAFAENPTKYSLAR